MMWGVWKVAVGDGVGGGKRVSDAVWRALKYASRKKGVR